jgi:Tol biopolymer transport system component
VLDVATGAERQIVSTLGQISSVVPAWSPDGRTIAFTPQGRVDLVSPDGAKLGSFRPDDNYPSHVRWSPDATQLTLSVGGAFSNAIFVVARDGTGLRKVFDPGFAVAPAWSPDGRWIACVANQGVHADASYRLVSPDGKTQRLLARAAPSYVGPAWSPDSKELLYAAPDGSLHAIGVEGGGDRVVVASARRGGVEAPDWRR